MGQESYVVSSVDWFEYVGKSLELLPGWITSSHVCTSLPCFCFASLGFWLEFLAFPLLTKTASARDKLESSSMMQTASREYSRMVESTERPLVSSEGEGTSTRSFLVVVVGQSREHSAG